MPVLVHDGNLSLAAPGRPDAAQRNAVAAAERRARALLTLPAYTLKWVHAPSSRAWGCTRYTPPRVYLRDDLTPSQCYTTALHELQHVADTDQILELST